MEHKIRLFALARERVGRAEVVLDLPEHATVTGLKDALARAFPGLAPLVPSLLIAVNAEYAIGEQTIPPGAEVAVIPPVSGG